MDTEHDVVQELRRDFREHLERFYARLKLAPPYHHVEKAVTELVARVKAIEPEARRGLLADETRRWTLYREAFLASGLPHKHRGIIIGLIQAGKTRALPREYDSFLSTFRES